MSDDNPGRAGRNAPADAAESASYMGATPAAPDANTNLNADLPTGPQTDADRQAAGEVRAQHADRGLPAGTQDQQDSARQMDNSGLLGPDGTGPDADRMGASGEDRNEAP